MVRLVLYHCACLLIEFCATDELDEQYLDSDAPNRYTNVYPRPNETLAMDPTVLQLNRLSYSQ